MTTAAQRSEARTISAIRANGTPQENTLLTHLLDRPEHGISQLEATHLYRIAALPRRAADLQDWGLSVRKERRRDPTGRAYVRYFLDRA